MKNFIQNAIRTESGRLPVNTGPAAPDNDQDILLSRLLHASIGMNTEQAEFADMLKKHLFYGKPLDRTNLKEELGDILWYIAIGMDALGTNFEFEMGRVINKLRTRFPDKFTDHHAENRDLAAERAVLENEMPKPQGILPDVAVELIENSDLISVFDDHMIIQVDRELYDVFHAVQTAQK